MIAAGAVVLDAPAKLGEYQDHGVVLPAVLFQVGHEIPDGAGDLVPQLCVGCQLAGMGVEAAVLGVEDTGSQVGEHHLGHVFHGLGQGIGRVLNRRLVHGGSGAQNIRALQGVATGLTEELQHGVLALGAAVHLGKCVQGESPDGLILQVREQPVGFQVAHRGYRNAPAAQRPGQSPSEIDAGEDVLSLGVQVPDNPSQPPLGADPFGQSGVPDVHGPEVGAVGVGVADAVDDGHLTLIPQPFHRPHAGVEANLIIQGQHLV